jgi:hypothetical protein
MRCAVLALALPLLGATSAAAQGRARPARPAAATPKAWFGVNAGAQTTTTEFDDRFDFTLYQETATTRVQYPIESGFLFDAGGGVRLWRGLGAGLAVSRFAADGTAGTSTSLPHPFFLAQPRQVDGDADGIRRTETGIHLQAQYTIPVSRTVELLLAAGPSILLVNQTLVTSVNYSEEYPYDTATFTGVERRDASGSAVGFHAGVDVRWRLSRSVGIGAVARFTRATIDLDASDNRSAVTVDAGGVHVGAGLRFVF